MFDRILTFHFRLTAIPSDISQCHKLHVFNYAGNKLNDKKLAKMMDQCRTKAVLGRIILEYLITVEHKEVVLELAQAFEWNMCILFSRLFKENL